MLAVMQIGQRNKPLQYISLSEPSQQLVESSRFWQSPHLKHSLCHAWTYSIMRVYGAEHARVLQAGYYTRLSQ